MGHATRAVPVVTHLRKRYEVHLFCGGPAVAFLRSKFPNVHRVHRIKPVFIGDRVSLPLVYGRAFATLPMTFASIAKIAALLARRRPIATITDFEAHGTYATLLMRRFFGTRLVEFDNFSAMRFCEPPFELSSDKRRELEAWRGAVRWVVPVADRVLVQSPRDCTPAHPAGRRVPPPVRDEFIRYDGPRGVDGPIVVSLGSRKAPSLPAVLREAGMAAVVYGWGEERREGRVHYRRFHEREYIADLARAPFAVVSANSSALDAIALRKPVLVNPLPGQFEQWFSSRSLEALGVGRHVDTLTPACLAAFANDAPSFRATVEASSFFDNEAVFAALDWAIG